MASTPLRQFSFLTLCVLILGIPLLARGEDATTELQKHRFILQFEGRTVPFRWETGRVAILLEDAPLEVLPESFLDRFEGDPLIDLSRAERTLYPGLWWVPTLGAPLERDLEAALERLDGEAAVRFAAPVLLHDRTIQVPKDELLITLDEETSIETLRALIATPDLEWLREFPGRRPLHHFRVHGRVADLFERAREVAALPGVAAADPNFIQQHALRAVPSDLLFGSQWYHRNTGQVGVAGSDAHSTVAWDVETGSPTITIAIIDEGVDSAHPDLAAQLVAGHESTNQASPSGIPGNPASTEGHGTACAGIAAAIGNNGIGVAGTCWNVSIQSVRIFSGGFTENAWIIDAITWATDNGADVLSNSWGGGAPTTAEQNTIQYALTMGRGGLGCVPLFASGNANSNVDYPAQYPQTIAVGASSPCDERKTPTSCDGETWWGSNFGTAQSIVAPGVLMMTTDITGAGGYVSGDYISNFNGTSSATPLAAGAAALLLSADPSLTATQVRSFLEGSAADLVGLPSQDVPGWDPHMGFGRLDIGNMIALLGGPVGPTGLTCTEPAPNSILLSWTNGDTYDQVEIFLDATVIATLPGTATSHTEPGVAVGLASFTVRGVVGGLPTISAPCDPLVLGNSTELVWNPAAGFVNGGLALGQALVANGRSGILTDTLSLIPDLNAFQRIWVCLGVFPFNFVLADADAIRLLDFLTDGVGGEFLYLEGGDTWFFDPATPVHPLFQINGLSDGAAGGNLTTVVGTGSAGCDLTGINLVYTGENNFIDRIAPLAGAEVIQSNTSAPFDVAIFNDAGTHRTIGASFELGGFFDGASTRADLIGAYLGCFGGSFVPPVGSLVCIEAGSDVTLVWTNPGGLDAVEVERDGGVIATLPGAAVSFVNSAVPVGPHFYTVRGIVGGLPSNDAACLADVLPLPVTGLICGESGGQAQLSWLLGGSYDAIDLRRDGALLATIAGGATSFTDPAPPGGDRGYDVIPSASGLFATAASCAVSVPPDPVTALACAPIGGLIQLTWTNAELYGVIDVRRDGALLTTIAGNLASHLDSTASVGPHDYEVIPRTDGIPAVATGCSTALAPGGVTGISCVGGVQSATVSWTNGDSYDTVEVRRDSVLVASLPGTSTNFPDPSVPVGGHSYEVRGSVAGVLSPSNSCSATSLPPAVGALSCVGGVGSASLSWTDPVTYASIEVRRGGVLIASLPGTATSHVDGGPPIGPVSYGVTGSLAGLDAPESTCATTVALPPIATLSCTVLGADVGLTWTLGGTIYDAIELRRDGAVIASLSGTATSFVDLAPPGGSRVYSLTPSLGGTSATSTDCSASVPPAAVVGIACALVDPCSCLAEAAWSNAELYDAIEVRLDGSLVATLPGSATIASIALPGNGTFNLCVRPIIDGIDGADSCCGATCPTVPADPIGALTCAVDDPTCTVTVGWGANASAAIIEVRLDGILVNTLPGTATATTVSLGGPASGVIEVSGTNGCGSPLTPSTCGASCQSPLLFIRGTRTPMVLSTFPIRSSASAGSSIRRACLASSRSMPTTTTPSISPT